MEGRGWCRRDVGQVICFEDESFSNHPCCSYLLRVVGYANWNTNGRIFVSFLNWTQVLSIDFTNLWNFDAVQIYASNNYTGIRNRTPITLIIPDSYL